MSYHDEYLYHHGIKGMKWGIRRFQNKNGRLTLLGKKRRRAADDSDSNIKSKKPEKPKTVKDMSDQELKNEIARLNLERQYLDLNKQVNALNPKELSRGEKFVSAINKHVVPELTNVAKRVVSDYMNNKARELLGLDDKDSVEYLKKEVLKLNLKKQKNELDEYFNKQSNNDSTATNKNSDSNSSKNNKTSEPSKNANTQKTESSYDTNSNKTSEPSKNANTNKTESSYDTNSNKASSSSTFQRSNSNSKSIHDVYKTYYDSGRTTVNSLYKSGYSMPPVSTIYNGKKVSNGKALLSDLSGWKMTSLEDLERR